MAFDVVLRRLSLLLCLSIFMLFSSLATGASGQQMEPEPVQQSAGLLQQWALTHILKLQDRLARLEVKLEQKRLLTNDVKNTQLEVQALKVQLAELSQKLIGQKDTQIAQFSALEQRITDNRHNTNRWGYVFTFLGFILSMGVVILGVLVPKRALEEAKSAVTDYFEDKGEEFVNGVGKKFFDEKGQAFIDDKAKTYFDEKGQAFIDEQGNKLIDEKRTDFDNIHKDISKEMDEIRVKYEQSQKELTTQHKQLESLVKLYEPKLEELYEKANLSIDNTKTDPRDSTATLSDEQKQQLNLATRLKSEDEFTHKDWYQRSTVSYSNDDYETALENINEALRIESQVADEDLVKYLFRKALCNWKLGDTEAEIEAYDQIVRRFSHSKNLKLQIYMAISLRNKGVSLDSSENAINAFDQLIELYGKSSNLDIQRQVAKGMRNKGFVLTNLKRNNDAVLVFGELISRFKESSDTEVQLQVAMGHYDIAICYDRLGKSDAELTYYDYLVTNYRDHSSSKIQEQVAMGLKSKAITLGELDRNSEEIDTYDELYELFGDSSNSAIQIITAEGLFNKSLRLEMLERNKDAVESFNQLIELFGESTITKIQEQVVGGILEKALVIGKMEKYEQAIGIFDDLINQFKESNSSEIQKSVSIALANSAELSILCETSEQVLERISSCEQVTESHLELAVMVFLRFILNNKLVEDLTKALKNLPEDIEFTWKFDEIKPYINEKFTGKKLQQCLSVMSFFEEHHDIERLEKELDAIEQNEGVENSLPA